MANQLTDPVCGMQVEASKNAMKYRGVNYAFCSPHCRKKFSDEPENTFPTWRQSSPKAAVAVADPSPRTRTYERHAYSPIRRIAAERKGNRE